MNKEKRTGKTGIPDDIETLLNEAQRRALRQIENFGWHLEFIRRPVFQAPVAVVVNSKGDQIGVLEDDGRIDMQTDIELRDAAPAVDIKDTSSGC